MSNSDKNILPVGEDNNSHRTFVLSVLAVIVIVASMLAIKTMQEAPNAGAGGPGGGSMSMPPAAVFVEPIIKDTVQAEAFVTGVLRATSEASIAAREPGAVVEVFVDEGDIVKKNAIIARLDSRRITALLAEAKAALASAKGLEGQRKAELIRAQSDLEMKRGLLKSKAVSQSDLLDADRAMAVARAQDGVAVDGIAEAESRLNFLNIQLKDLTILAPFDGVIVDRQVEPGEWVAAGSIVASLVTVDPVEAWLRVPSRFLDDLSSDSKNFRVRRSSSGHVIVPRKIEIIPVVEPLSQLFTVIATIPNPNGKLASGESITGLLPIGDLEPHWCFSTDALIRSESGDFVYVALKPEQEGSLPGSRKIPIEIAFERGNKAFVAVSSSGFTEGDRVIVEGNERLIPGQSLMVKVREEVSMPPTR